MNQRKMLSRNLSYQEGVISRTAIVKGINNIPSDEVLQRMKLTANKVFQPVRDYFNKPIRVSSFYRSLELNKEVGGSKTSQHITGEAMDIQGTNGITNKEIFDYIKNNLEFDQLIWEYGTTKEPAWVHVSYRGSGRGKNRKQILYIGVKK